MNKKNTQVIPAPLLFLFLLSITTAATAQPPSANTGVFHMFFYQGGPLVWCVLLPLSLLSGVLIIQYLLTVRRSILLPVSTRNKIETLKDQIKNTPPSPDTLHSLQKDGSLLARAAHIALAETDNGPDAMEYAVREAIDKDATDLFRRIEWLHIIGNVAPMIGLFGTVWGMIEAFNGIVRAGGQPEPADLAAGISVALVTTWWGLVVAIPALAVYGYLRNRIDSLAAEVALAMEWVIQNIQKPTESTPVTT